MYLRHLDIDDLIVLTSLLDHTPLSTIAKNLGLTPPALSHRMGKYRTHIPNFKIETSKKNNKNVTKMQLSEETKQFCLKAKLALQALGEYANKNEAA
jgi:predicted transcriptional regulator